MRASRRIREIARRAYGLLEKEFCSWAFVHNIVELSVKYDKEVWEGIEPPTEAESLEALGVLERSGRVLRDVRGIHEKDANPDEFDMFYVPEYYPNSCWQIREYKRSRDYKGYLAHKKYGYVPGWKQPRFRDPELERKRAEENERFQKDRIAFAASHPSHGAMKTPMPEKCPICFTDLRRETCRHTWDEMLERMKTT